MATALQLVEVDQLCKAAFWPCASPAYLAKRGMPTQPGDLTSHAIVADSHKPKTSRFIARSETIMEVELHPVTVVPEPAVVRTMLLGGTGVGWLPNLHAIDAITDGSLIRVLPEWSSGAVEAHALYPSHRGLSAKVRVFIDALIEHLGRRVPGGGTAV